MSDSKILVLVCSLRSAWVNRQLAELAVETCDETRKSSGIAGPRIVEDLKSSVPGKDFDGKHPRDNAQVVGQLSDIVAKLAAEIG